MAAYNRRDLFSHWISKDQPANRPCHHACCRGMRPHPEKYPVIKRNAYLRYSSDAEIMSYWRRHSGDTPSDVRIQAQILAEMQRRDVRDERREEAEERRRARYSARRIERQEEINRNIDAAEEATNGYMLNRRGREANISERSLFTGPESRARKYASEELLEYWEHHGRPTGAYFAGHDTRIGYANTGVRRRMTSEEQDWRDRFEQAESRAQDALAG